MNGICKQRSCSGRIVEIEYKGHGTGDYECDRCGWQPPKQGRRDRKPADHHGDNCAYEYNGQRCPFPGTFAGIVRVGPNRKPPNGPWYCRHHERDENRRADLAQSYFFEALKKPGAIAQQMREWYPNGRSATTARFDEVLGAHPEWHRQSGEGHSEYIDRISGMARAMARQQLARHEATRADGKTEGER